MISRILMVLFLCLASIRPVVCADAAFEHGPRPPRGFYDPAGVIDGGLVDEIVVPLEGFRMREGVDVIVVVLPDIGEAPPGHVAWSFAHAWCRSRIHAVVLHVPGHKNSPWIVPGGELLGAIQPEKINRAVEEAVGRALREPTDAGKVRAASVEATDMLRYWLGTAINRGEHIRTERVRFQLEVETRARQRRIIAMVATVSAIPLIVGISMLVVALRKPGPRRFPSTQVPNRLGAPYCGGNHAVYDLGGPSPTDNR
jgi:uncharacterized membrane protein YgcG